MTAPSEMSYQAVLGRRQQIVTRATGFSYDDFERPGVAFDDAGLLDIVGMDDAEIRAVQLAAGVGDTPLLELGNLTELIRSRAPAGKGARIFVKDEAANPSGSFKDRRAALSAHHAKEHGFRGLVAATSGNYGAGVASQAARHGLDAVIVQEAFDSAGRGQPEILEKGRKCEALGAEVLQTTVGPELFYVLLRVLEETGFFNASLYTPFSVRGIETLGVEIAQQTRSATGRDPDVVLATHAGGGMVTGTARGLRAAGALSTKVVGVSVDLQGLHMASDADFNRKSFTTGHTGFSVPFTSWPDRVDVPRNAARPLRYLDRFVLVTQGEVFYATTLLSLIEGLERGPAGNTSLAAAVPIAAELDRDQVVVISETEYTGAGKSPVAQLEFARELGVEIRNGDACLDAPGSTIAIPLELEQLQVADVRLDQLRRRYVSRLTCATSRLSAEELAFAARDSGLAEREIEELLAGR